MEKILTSGIKVDAEKYYELLEWKDKNLNKFNWWCNEYRNIFPETRHLSINRFTESAYNTLLDFTNR